VDKLMAFWQEVLPSVEIFRRRCCRKRQQFD